MNVVALIVCPVCWRCATTVLTIFVVPPLFVERHKSFPPFSVSTCPFLSLASALFVHTLVLTRHGEYTWNKENRFTRWMDVLLSKQGIAEAKQGGDLLCDSGLTFDLAYISMLKRAIKTL